MNYRNIKEFINPLAKKDPQLHEALSRLNESVADLFKFANNLKLPVANPVEGAKVQNSADISIPNDTITTPTFDTVLWDTANMHSIANSSRLTVRRGGIWIFGASVAWAAGTTGYRLILIRKNAGPILANDRRGAVGDSARHTAIGVARLKIGDYIEANVQHTEGVALSLTNGVANGEHNLIFWAVRLIAES